MSSSSFHGGLITIIAEPLSPKPCSASGAGTLHWTCKIEGKPELLMLTDRNCHFEFFAVLGQNSVFSPNYDCFRKSNQNFPATPTPRSVIPVYFCRQPLIRANATKLTHITSPTKPYKLRFRGVILFRINFVFGYYTDTSACSGGERAQTDTG